MFGLVKPSIGMAVVVIHAILPIYRANKIMLHFLHFLHFLHLNRLGGCCIRPRYWA